MWVMNTNTDTGKDRLIFRWGDAGQWGKSKSEASIDESSFSIEL